MRSRTSATQLERDSAESFADAARAVGLDVAAGQEKADVQIALPDGRLLPAALKAVSLPTAETIRALLAQLNEGELPIVIADQIAERFRAELNDAGIGWFDRRGHLRLVADGLFVDADVPPQLRGELRKGSRRQPINGRSGLAAAAALLLEPDHPIGLSELARVADLNPSSITRAMAALVDAHLAERRARGHYRALVPELFWALAEVWPRDAVSIRWNGSPDVRELHSTHAVVDAPGWAEAGVPGAIAWGAPLVATADYPRHWYVPDARDIRRLATLHAGGTGAEWHLSADPIGLITTRRFGDATSGWPRAHPLFCALDLTVAARDREALEQWTPPPEFTRVW